MRRLALLYGPRQSEVLGLKWSDLNINTGDLHIQRALRRDAGVGRPVMVPKSSESIRGTAATGSSPAAEARHWRSARDSRLWKALLERAGVRHVGLHDARHTAGALVSATGTEPRPMQRILGHANVLIRR